jgi:hypothetical protein
MQILTYDEIVKHFGAVTEVSMLQKLGFESDGTPLVIDGDLGPKTKGGTFVLMEEEDGMPMRVQVALSELVQDAREVPLGRNSGPFVAKYFLSDDDEKNHGSWCAAFASWCLAQDDSDAPRSVGVRRLLKRLDEDEDYTKVSEEASDAQLGDLIFWSRPPKSYHGHVGFVLGVKDGYLYTVEGNAGPYVRCFRYEVNANALRNRKGILLGLVRPTTSA